MRFNIPPVIRALLLINVVCYLAQINFNLTEWGSLHHWTSPLFKPHQLITYQFMHDPEHWSHLIFNMLVLWMFGSLLENHWGAKRFLNFYLICGVGAGLVQMAIIPWEIRQAYRAVIPPDMSPEDIRANLQPVIDRYQLMGASGAIMGLMAAFAYLFPNLEMIIFPIPVPVKAKFVIPVYVLIDLFSGFNRQQGDNTAHWAHLGGALVGIITVIIMNRTNRRNFY